MNSFNEHHKKVTENIAYLAASTDIQYFSRTWMQEASFYNYTYNFSWLSHPIIQYPQDIVALQEIIWEVQPDLIIETGIAHGGSLIFSASMLALLDVTEAIQSGTKIDIAKSSRSVLGIDVYIKKDNRAAIEEHPMSSRVQMIEGSSIDPDVILQVKEYASKFNKILVILDSLHTHDHVLSELRFYAPFVSYGSYIIVCDTIIEDMPNSLFPDRPWCKGNNPKTAVWQFLHELEKNSLEDNYGNPIQFKIDKDLEHKLLITVAPDGYLKRS